MTSPRPVTEVTVINNGPFLTGFNIGQEIPGKFLYASCQPTHHYCAQTFSSLQPVCPLGYFIKLLNLVLTLLSVVTRDLMSNTAIC